MKPNRNPQQLTRFHGKARSIIHFTKERKELVRRASASLRRWVVVAFWRPRLAAGAVIALSLVTVMELIGPRCWYLAVRSKGDTIIITNGKVKVAARSSDPLRAREMANKMQCPYRCDTGAAKEDCSIHTIKR